MLKRSYLALTLAAVLGAGAVFAFGADADAESQQEKDKQESKEQEKAKAEERAMVEAFSLPLIAGSGSYLGVYLEEVTSERVKSLGLSEERGAIVYKVVEGSPAEKAGLKENDVIVSFNGRPIESVRELQRLLAETPEGRSVSMEVVRSGSRQNLSATLTKRSPRFEFFGLDPKGESKMWSDREREMVERQRQMAEELAERTLKNRGDFGTYNFTAPRFFESSRDSRLGVSVETLSGQLAEYFGVSGGKGLLVSEVIENTPAAKAGLKAGDVIIAVDGEKVDRAMNLIEALRAKGEGVVTLTVVRNRSEQAIPVTIEKVEPRLRPQPRRRAVSTGAIADVI